LLEAGWFESRRYGGVRDLGAIMSRAIDDLLAILNLEQLEHNLFRGRRSAGSGCSAAK
jgi:hypothetical protein